jgi:hypothetical protein
MAPPKRLLALVAVSIGSLVAINSLLDGSTVAVQSASSGEGNAELNRLHNQHKMLLGRAMELRQRYANGAALVENKPQLSLERDRDVLKQRIAAATTDAPTAAPTIRTEPAIYELPLLRAREPYGSASSEALRAHDTSRRVSNPGPLRPNSVTEFIASVVDLIGKLQSDEHAQVLPAPHSTLP